MKLKLCTALLTAATLLAPLSFADVKAQDAAMAKRAAVASYGKLPLSFEPTASLSRFLARSGSYAVLIGAGQSSVAVTDAKSGKHQTLRFAFDNANPAAQLQAMEPQPGVTNYYLGRDSGNWRLGVKSYARLRSAGVYPGVDVVYYGDHRRLEFDFAVAPKADPGAIALSFSGMDKFYKEAGGDLVAEVAGQPVRFAKPYAYQKVDGASHPVDAEYELAADGKVHLRLGDYDRSRELIIDPVVSYATFLGGSQSDAGNGIAVDSTGAVYITGQTCSNDFPDSANPSGLAFSGACDAYVTKYAPGGAAYVYTTILGGSIPANASASGNGIALDATNEAYITGTTNIEDLPLNVGGAANVYQGGDSDAFIAILDASGALQKSSYLGGSGADAGYGITVDVSNNVTVVGQTCSQDFPAYSAFETKVEACVAFVTKLDNNLDIGSKVNGTINPLASALSPAPASGGGKTYYFSEFYGGQPVAPYPTAGAWEPTTAYPQGAIVLDNQSPAHIEIAQNDGVSGPYVPASSTVTLPIPNWNTSLLGITLEGGMTWEDYGVPAVPPVAFSEAYGVTLDPPGDVFLAGGTNSTFLASSIWPCHPGGTGAWVLKVFGRGGGCSYEWTLENTPTDLTATIDTARAIAVDSEGRAYVVGTATGSARTTGNSYNASNSGGADAFLARVNQLGSALDYMTYLGGSSKDQGLGVAVDGDFSPYVTGSTQSMDFPTINPLTNPNSGNPIPLSGTQNAFITKFTSDGTALIFSSFMGGSSDDQGNSIAVANDPTNKSYVDMFVAGTTTSTDFEATLLEQPMTAPSYVPPQATYGGNGDAFVTMIPGASIPTVTVMPGSLAFPYQNVGTTSTAQAVLYRNTNSISTVQIGTISFSNPEFQQAAVGGNPPDCGNGSLVPPLSTCNVWVIFTPAAQTLQTGTLTITDDASSAPHVINLSGEGAVPTDSFSPSNLAFANQGVGTASATKSVTLTNTSSTGTLLVSSITVGGVNSGDFSESDNCQSEVAPSGTCTINVIFTPTAASTRSGNVTVTDNAPGSPHVIDLSGTGVLTASTVTPSSLTFPQQGMNVNSAPQTVTVKNTDPTQTLIVTSIATTGDYQVNTNTCTTPLVPAGTCTVLVVFDPTLPGTRTGTLIVSGNGTTMPATVSLSGTAGASATLLPSTLSFSGTNVGTTSASQAATFSNLSSFAFNVQSVAISGPAAGDFLQTNNCGTSVSAFPATCTINVSFTPTATGNRNATITVTSDTAASPQSVAIVGVGTAPLVTLAPPMNSTVNFGNQPLSAASAPLTITLTNSGTGPLNMGAMTITGAAPNDFTQTNNCGTQVAAGTFCTIYVVFTPTALNSRSASLNIADNAVPNPQVIALLGSGVQVQAPTIAPPSLSFGSQPLNQASATQTVVVTNTDPNYALSLGVPATTGDFHVSASSTTCTTTLPKSSICLIGVTFTPTASGARTGTMTVANNGSTAPLTVQLTGSGGAVASVNPTSLNLGSANIGQSSASQAVTLTNSSTFPVNITSVSFSGASASQFVATNNCGTIVPASGNCTIGVVFVPAATGIQTATMTIASDAATAFAPVLLTGTGTAPVVSLSPQSVTFPNQPLNVVSAAIPITLTNTGTGPLSFGSITLTGTNAGDFAESNNCGSQLLASSSCVINVTFTPTAVNSRIASLVIPDDAANSPQSVALSGTGVSGSGTIQLTPAAVAFGNVQVGTTSSPATTVTLANTSSTSVLTVNSIAVVPAVAGNADFAIVSSTASGMCPSGSFSLATGTSCQIQLTFSPSATGAEKASLQVNGSESNSSQAVVALTGTGTTTESSAPDFSLNPTNGGGEAVTQGGTATYNVSVAPVNGYTGTIAFSCIVESPTVSGQAAAGSSCAVSPNSLTISGSTAPTIMVSVNTAATSAQSVPPQRVPRSIFLALLPFSMMGMLLINKRRGMWLVLGLVVLCLLLGMVGCGSGSSKSSSGLAPNTTYTVMLTGTANGLAPVNVPLQLVVNQQ